MTFSELLAFARAKLEAHDDPSGIAKAVIDVFGEDQLCGMPEPEVYPGQVIITREMTGVWEPDFAHSLGVALIRAAEKGREGV